MVMLMVKLQYSKGSTVSAYIGSSKNLKDLKERTQGFTADPDYWKGEVFVYVGRNQNLKDLKSQNLQDLKDHARLQSF